MVRSYISAIKQTLIDDGYAWNDNIMLLSSLTRACKLVNDRVKPRFPISYSLLELILFELSRIFMGEASIQQPYLCIMYQAMFALGHYGLLRVGELTLGQHTAKAQHMHVATNKPKIKVVLYSSKMHGQGSLPQTIKIITNFVDTNEKRISNRYFCPFDLMRKYMLVRDKNYVNNSEPLFIFRDGTPVKPEHARSLLRSCLTRLGLNANLYDMQSFRIGRASDMINKFNYSIEAVKRVGHWKSSSMYRYIRN